MDLGLKGKLALIGGASKGLGLASALALSNEGCDVILVSRSTEHLDAAKCYFPNDARVSCVMADLSTSAGVARCIQEVDAIGPIDILVNNAGGPPPGGSFDLDDDAWRAANEALLLYVKRMCDHFIPRMRKRGWGRVITITSLTVREPIETLVLSNVYRAGITAYLKGVAREAAQDGVTVNSVLPGAYRTERYEELLASRSAKSGRTVEQEAATVADAVPQKRFQDPAELGAVVAFLASVRASAINGAAVPVEGGMLRGMW